jgi:hypothetical protein
MQKVREVTRSLEFDDLKAMANTKGPCLTLYLPMEKSPNTYRLEEMRLKSVIRSAEQALSERKVPAGDIRTLLEPLPGIAQEREHLGSTAGGTLVVLRSKNVFRAFDVRHAIDETVYVGEHFNIRPILKCLEEDKLEFYLLALSQKHVRLLRCTHHESAEIPLPAGVPTNLEDWLNTRLPNAAPHHGTPEGGDNGSTGGSFTSTTDRDNKDGHLANFYRVINKGITDMLKDQTVPIVLCGVDYERSMYRSINTYATLVEDGVQGSPESLKGGEMHKRALEIAQEYAKEPMKKALGTYERLGGTERVCSKPEEILKAAAQGRVAFLFLSDGASYNGRFDDATMQVSNDGFKEDLLNVAALRTIAYGGEVFVTVPGRIPAQGPMAAILRF